MIKHNIIYNGFSDFQFTVSKAKGSFIWDDKGKKLIDFTSGWNVTNLGWNNEEINKAMIDQVRKNIYSSMWTEDPIQHEYATKLIESLPKGLELITREATGVTANIMAIKTARAYTGKKKILSFRDTFHGSLYQTLQLGYAPEYPVSKSIFLDFKYNIHLTYPKVSYQNVNEAKILSKFCKQLEDTLKSDSDIAAFITESGVISGWGSTYLAPKGFLREIRKLTSKYGVLLIVDEVGTGFSRTGELFGINHENVVPDIMVFAKGMGNGAVIAATVTTREIGEKSYTKSNPQSTFAWTPPNVAAAMKTLEIHKRDKMWKKAKKDGEYLLKTLRSELMNSDIIDDINGMGMEIGVHLKSEPQFKTKMREFISKARYMGLHLAYADETNFQLMPPLTIERKDLDQGIEIFVKLLK